MQSPENRSARGDRSLSQSVQVVINCCSGMELLLRVVRQLIRWS